MTIEQLKQYRSICAEIEEKTIELNEKSIHSTVTGSDSEFPYTKHTIPISGISEGNTRLIVQLESLKREKQLIENFVDGIGDSLTRRIFEYRYTKGNKQLKWSAIAFRVGGGNTADGIRMAHNRFLEKI